MTPTRTRTRSPAAAGPLAQLAGIFRDAPPLANPTIAAAVEPGTAQGRAAQPAAAPAAFRVH